MLSEIMERGQVATIARMGAGIGSPWLMQLILLPATILLPQIAIGFGMSGLFRLWMFSRLQEFEVEKPTLGYNLQLFFFC